MTRTFSSHCLIKGNSIVCLPSDKAVGANQWVSNSLRILSGNTNTALSEEIGPETLLSYTFMI
jgi:hypothetical protein